MRLENWYLVTLGSGTVAMGQVYGHPKLPDGASFQTLRILGIDTTNHILLDLEYDFELGKVDKVWASKNNFERVLAEKEIPVVEWK